MSFKNALFRTAASALLLLSAGCASAKGAGKGNNDPIEPVNRKIFWFNEKVDKYVLDPVAHGYMKITPRPVRNSIGNFFANLSLINTVPNDLLQGKFKQGAEDTGSFVVNSTVGVLGLFDVGKKIGLDRHQEDLGQTLGVWGFGEGPYLVLPLAGPATLRDVPGRALNTAIHQALVAPAAGSFAVPMNVVGAVDKRADADEELDRAHQMAMDPYTFIREGYRQNRDFQIHGGASPESDPFAELNEALEEADGTDE